MSPAMRRKGRLQVDADADIVAFDLATVTDQATYAESCRVSAGIRHLLVNGVPLISGGRLDTTVLPGRPAGACGLTASARGHAIPRLDAEVRRHRMW
jgi:N-acyl-D-aspartate/D-glutamate deacylase